MDKKAPSCNPKTIRFVETLSVLISLIAIALLFYSLLNTNTIDDTLKEGIIAYGIPGVIISSALLDLIPQFISPFIILATIIVAGVNPLLAIFLVILGSTIGATIGFSLGKKYMFQVVYCLVKPRTINKMTNLMNRYGKWAVSLAAISPLPYLPILIGALNFSKRNFLLYGLLPRAIGLTLFGILVNLF